MFSRMHLEMKTTIVALLCFSCSLARSLSRSRSLRRQPNHCCPYHRVSGLSHATFYLIPIRNRGESQLALLITTRNRVSDRTTWEHQRLDQCRMSQSAVPNPAEISTGHCIPRADRPPDIACRARSRIA